MVSSLNLKLPRFLPGLLQLQMEGYGSYEGTCCYEYADSERTETGSDNSLHTCQEKDKKSTSLD